LVLQVRRAGRAFDVAAAAGAGVDEFLFLQPPEGGLVEFEAVGLKYGPFIPIQSQPAQIRTSLLGRSRLDARRIQVLDGQDATSALRADQEPGQDVCAGVADVLRARGRGSQSADWSGRQSLFLATTRDYPQAGPTDRRPPPAGLPRGR